MSNNDFAPILERIEQELSKALPTTFTDSWKQNAFGSFAQQIADTYFDSLQEPCRQLVQLGGKRWRPLLLVLTAMSAQEHGNDSFNQDWPFQLTPLLELVHTASLIHDDIEDSSPSRRGQPAAYITFGTDRAINSGSWLYFHASTIISKSDFPDSTKLRLYQLWQQELSVLHLGQAMDISWHQNPTFFPTQEEYMQMVMSKTGTLSSMAFSLGGIAADLDPETIQKLSLAGRKIGAGFQIIDDVTNITKGNNGKKRGDDIVEGKKSLPVILFAQKCQQQGDTSPLQKLQNCFQEAGQDGINSPKVEQAIELLQHTGVIQQALQMGKEYIEQALDTVREVFGNNNSGYSQISKLFHAMIPEI